MSIAEPLAYRSPVSKLLRFFRRSRDQWKSKCKVAKQENKSLKIRLAKMTKSRDRWKAKAQCSEKPPEMESPPPETEPKNHVYPTARGPRARGARVGMRAK